MSRAIFDAPTIVPGIVPYWRHGKRHGENTTVFCTALCYVVVNLLAEPNPVDNIRDLILAFRCRENTHGLSYGLLRCVAKDALGSAIPAPDNPVQILADDRIIRRLDDSCKPLLKFGRALLVRDVASETPV